MADRVELRNVLQRHGYESLDAIRAEGHAEGRIEKARTLLRDLVGTRFGRVPPDLDARIEAASEGELDAMARRLMTAASTDNSRH